MSVDDVGLQICLLGTSNFMVTLTFFFRDINWSGPGTSSTTNHKFYRALGWLHGPWCKLLKWNKLENGGNAYGHFTLEPRAMTMQLWEPKRSVQKTIPRHFQHHVVWSRALKCSGKSYVTKPSTKCSYNEILFKQGPHTRWNIMNQWLRDFRVPWPSSFVLGLPPRGHFWT